MIQSVDTLIARLEEFEDTPEIVEILEDSNASIHQKLTLYDVASHINALYDLAHQMRSRLILQQKGEKMPYIYRCQNRPICGEFD